MGMLKSIGLENYKCFKDKAEIEVAPLTVLCGENSSGKSSIIKSLLMLKQSYENTLSNNDLTFNGKYVDNGVFQDVAYNGAEKFFTIENTFSIKRPPKKTLGITESDATSFNELKKMFRKYSNESIDSFLFTVSIMVFGNINESDISKRIKNIIYQYKIEIDLLNKDNSSIANNDISILLDYCKGSGYNFGKKYDINIKNIPFDTDEKREPFNDVLTECSCYFEGIKLVKLYKQNPGKYLELGSVLPNIYSIFRIISTQYKNIKHLSPLRTSPNRRYIFDETINSTGPGGEFTAQTLYRYNDKLIHYYAPPINNNGQTIKLDTMMSAARAWANYFKMGELMVEPTEEMLKITLSGRNISDVGFGISQGLPVLVECLLLNNAETLLLEQPEVHLHPKMQMNMADLLIATSKNNKSIIVETHSDHIINRIIKRIIQDKTGNLNKNISILFLSKNINNEPIISPITIDDSKGVVNWPDGFFDQFQSEQEEIIRSGIEKRKYLRELSEK
jgi:predicted ATPase